MCGLIKKPGLCVVLATLALAPAIILVGLTVWHFIYWFISNDYVVSSIITSFLSSLYVLLLFWIGPKISSLFDPSHPATNRQVKPGDNRPRWTTIIPLYLVLVGISYLFFWLIRENAVGGVLLQAPWANVL